jgi:alpha-ketoglutarate-dependent 2,4-dichlorophenoxyacetate dioxygenase
MSLSVRPLHPRFVGEVGGVDIGRPLDTATVAALWQAIDRYAVVVFRGQMLDDERQMDFARQFLPRMPRRSSAGHCPTAACCCAT